MEERRKIHQLSERVDQFSIDLNDCKVNVFGKLNDLDSRLTVHQQDVSRISADITKITDTLTGIHTTIREVVEVWNNAKGFGNTVKFFSTVSKVVMPIMVVFSAIAAIWIWIYHNAHKWFA